VKTRLEVFGKPKRGDKEPDFGLQLRQMAGILTAHGLLTEIRVVNTDWTNDQIRDELRRNLERDGDFVIVNYHRPGLGQPGGGHISPVAAYDQESDSFLILDVNPNAAPWVWVATKDLANAMRTKDTTENRGYLLVTDSRR
jgi:hypothetical protein